MEIHFSVKAVTEKIFHQPEIFEASEQQGACRHNYSTIFMHILQQARHL
jgi:hypothetical protein